MQTGGSLLLGARGRVAAKEMRANGPTPATGAGSPTPSMSVGRSGSLGGLVVPAPPIAWQKVAEFSNHHLRFLAVAPEQNAEIQQVWCLAPNLTARIERARTAIVH